MYLHFFKENKEKSLPVNATRLSNNISHVKVDSSFNNNENKKENYLKRRIALISADKNKPPSYNNNIIPFEKRGKLSKSQDILEIDKTDVNPNNCTLISNEEEKLTAKMPKLVVKDRKGISYISHDSFPQFISLCLTVCHDNDMKKIVDKLKRRYEELNSVYTSSESFVLFINEKREAIMNGDKKLYVHINEVMNELKRLIKEQSKRKIKSIAYDAVPSTSYAMNTTLVNNMVKLNDKDGNTEQVNYNDDSATEQVDSNTRKNIKKIILAMKKCEYKIKKYEAEEVDFDDENDSNYIKEARYKERIVELYTKLCKLTGENNDAGRQYLRPKHIGTTQIVAVDQAITVTRMCSFKCSRSTFLGLVINVNLKKLTLLTVEDLVKYLRPYIVLMA